MDLNELRKKAPEQLLKLLRDLKLQKDRDNRLVRNIKLIYQEKISNFEIRVGHSDRTSTEILD